MTEFFISRVVESLPKITIFFFIALALGFAVRRSGSNLPKWVPGLVQRGVLFASIIGGLAFAWHRRAIYDDAFISFRFAQNFLDGNGLVFNIGERVEGYTNFLWTVLLAGVTWITGFQMPLVAFFGCLAAFVLNLITVYLIGKQLNASKPGQSFLPIAVLWLAFQHTFHAYGTTGLETMFASLMVNLAIYFLLAHKTPMGSFFVGLFLILATFTRPDHSLFYVCLAGVLAYGYIKQAWGVRSDWSGVKKILRKALIEGAAYSAPFVLYAGYMAWKYSYYGSTVPNTYYVNSANLSYWSQGIKYFFSFAFSSNLLFLMPLFFVWALLDRSEQTRRYRPFAAISVFVYVVYVMKIGGDKMFGRFFLTLMPLILIGLEHAAHRLWRSPVKKQVVLGLLLTTLIASTLHGIILIKEPKSLWQIADPSFLFRAHSINPLRVANMTSRGSRITEPRLLGEAIADKGINLVTSNGGIGIYSYYSKLPLIDRRGLTDAYVAHLPLAKRGKPGHEKLAPEAYLDYRNVRIKRGKNKKRSQYVNFKIGNRKIKDMYLYRYEGALMDEIAEKSPEFKFVRFPEHLDKNTDKYTSGTPHEVAKNLKDFDHYYFSLNPDPERRQPFVDRFIRLWDFEDSKYPEGTKGTGVFKEQGFIRPVDDKQWRIKNRQGEVVVGSPISGQGKGTLRLPPFEITGDVIRFLVGGDKASSDVGVKLLIDGKKKFSVTGTGREHTETMRWVKWKVKKFKGQKAQLIVFDKSKTKRILFDFLYEADSGEKTDAP